MKTATESSDKVKTYGLPDGNVNMAVYVVLFSISSIYVVPTMSAFVVGPSTSILCGWIGMRIAVSRVSGPRTSAGRISRPATRWQCASFFSVQRS